MPALVDTFWAILQKAPQDSACKEAVDVLYELFIPMYHNCISVDALTASDIDTCN